MSALLKTDLRIDTIPLQARFPDNYRPPVRQCKGPISGDLNEASASSPNAPAKESPITQTDNPKAGKGKSPPTGPGSGGDGTIDTKNSQRILDNQSSNIWTTIFGIGTGVLGASSVITHFTDWFGERKYLPTVLDIGAVSSATFWLSSMLGPISTDRSSTHHM